jgi:WD40 repeat protein/serine/threonine protein kinase
MASDPHSNRSVDEPLRRAFELAWGGETPPRIEEYVPQETDDPKWAATVEELVHIDLEFAWRRWAEAQLAGNAAAHPESVAGYLRRFPALNRPEVVARLVETERAASRKLPGQTVRHESDDPQLAKTVAAVREHSHESGGQTPHQIGPYKLLQKLGEGGMGVVWMAEQLAPIRRQVAVKMIKLGMDTEQVIARFEQERQALAMMDHPNIAVVFDAGATPNGRPYFVMELVKGLSITKYCDQEHLTPRERIELFLPVCQAVQHAHSKGIIHRDLKPSNVVVGLYDGKPVPKIIDFGVAKATLQRLTERTMFTEVGAVVGTLEYMAPEQAELNNLDIDTRADVYSLGVILYELLTGSPPFTGQQLRRVAFEEMRRMIREVDPPKPSTKVSSAENLPSIAANRKLEPGRLARLMRGELDWIVMKCLEKERASRYETSASLARDLEAYLSGDAIAAGPPSAWYRLSKLARRHRTAVSIVGLIMLLLVLGVLGSTTGWLSAISARDAKDQALRDTGEALRRETEARREARRSQALSELDYATQILERQGRRAGLLWLLRAWETMPEGDAKFDSFMRSNLAFWMHYPLPRFSLPHAGGIRAMAFSQDGKFLAVAGGQLRVWDVETGASVSPAMNAPFALSVRFSPNGSQLVTAQYHPVDDVRVWNWQAGTLAVPPLPLSGAIDAAFTGEGTTVIAGGSDPTDKALRLWDIATGEPKERTLAVKGIVQCLDIDRAGTRLLVGSGAGNVRIWDLKTLEALTEELPAAYPNDVEFSPDGKWIAAACQQGDNCARVWDAATGQVVGSDMQHPRGGDVVRIRFSPQSDRLLTSSSDASVQLWKLDAKLPAKPLGSFIERTTQARVDFNHDGSRFVVACLPGSVSIWDSASMEPIGPTLELDGSILSVGFHPRTDALVIGEGNGLASIWDLQDDFCQRSTIPTDTRVWDLQFTPDGRQLLVGKNGAKADVHSLETGQVMRSFPSEGNRAVASIARSTDGKIIVTGGFNGIGHVWNSRGERIGAELRNGPGDHAMFVVQISPDARTVLTGCGNRVALWDIGPQTRLRADWTLANMYAAVGAFSPDGALVITDNDSSSFALRSVATGQRVGALMPHAGYGVMAATFHPHGDQVLVAQNDLQLWSVPEGKFLGSFGRDLDARHIEFPADGDFVAVSCNDGSIRLFDMNVRRQIGPALPQLASTSDDLVGSKRYIFATRFEEDGRQLLSAGRIYSVADRPIQIARWRIPPPLEGKREAIAADMTRRLGVKLDSDGSVRRVHQ